MCVLLEKLQERRTVAELFGKSRAGLAEQDIKLQVLPLTPQGCYCLSIESNLGEE